MSGASDFTDALNAAVGMVPKLPRVRFECGLKPDAVRWLGKKHAGGAVHEPGTLAAFLALRQHYPDVRRIFDIGALFGYFALWAGSLWDAAKVSAFDMHPSAVQTLAVNTWPGTRVIWGVVGDRNEAKVKVWLSCFNIYEQPDGGWERLAEAPGAMKQRGDNNQGRGFATLNFFTLDRYCSETGEVPDLIKMDVEGFQTKAVQGSLVTIATHRPLLLIELHDPEKTARLHTSNYETVKPILDLGYRGYWCPNFRASDARFVPVDAMGPEHERLSLMVLVPEGRA